MFRVQVECPIFLILKNLKIILLFFTIVLCCSMRGYSQSNEDSVIVLKDARELALLGKQIYFLVDSTGAFDIKDILEASPKKIFQKNNTDVFLRAPSPNTYWLKIPIQHQSEEELYLEIATEYLWYVDYYVVQDGRYRLLAETGTMRPEKNRPYPVSGIWLKIPKSPHTQYIYLRLETLSIMEVPIRIGTLAQLHQNKSWSDYIFAGFVGAMLIMLGYNIFIFTTTRDKIYGIYCIYLFIVTFSTPFTNNYPFVSYVLGEAYRPLWYKYFFVWVSPTYFIIGIFTIIFLDLKNKVIPSYYILLGFLSILCLLLPLSNLFQILPYHVNSRIFQVILLGYVFFLLIVGSYLWIFKRQTQARFYTLAWAWVILSTFVVVLTINGVLPYNYLTRSATFLGTGLDILFFSLALGDRINKIKKEKEDIQKENLSLVEEQKEKLEIQVSERTQEIQKQKKDIEDSIFYAQRIQQAILPLKEEIETYLDNFFILFKPRSIVSGDFYYFQPVKDKIVLASIDCTGHGVPGAFMSMLSKEILDTIIWEKEILEADIILNELHKGIRKTLKQQQSYNRDGVDISLLVINPISKMVDFAGAKNSLVYITANQLVEIKGNKFSIGGEQKEMARIFSKHSIKIEEPTTLYIFSDGYQDQFGGEKGRKFSKSRLMEILLQINRQSMPEQEEILGQTLNSWIAEANERQIDDILIMGIRI